MRAEFMARQEAERNRMAKPSGSPVHPMTAARKSRQQRMDVFSGGLMNDLTCTVCRVAFGSMPINSAMMNGCGFHRTCTQCADAGQEQECPVCRTPETGPRMIDRTAGLVSKDLAELQANPTVVPSKRTMRRRKLRKFSRARRCNAAVKRCRYGDGDSGPDKRDGMGPSDLLASANGTVS